jgi:hypothetical protein
MERYLYFRQSATLTDDHDEVTGSNIYPASSFMGACSGDAALGGAIADDDDRLSLFFKPKAKQPGGAGDADDASADYNDIVVLDLTTVNTQKAVLTDLVNKMYGQPHITGMIDVFDGNAGTGLAGVSGIHVVEHSETAD